MNAPAEPTPAQQSAARLTAWAVDELPSSLADFEAALLADPARQSEADDVRAFCHLLEPALQSRLPESALRLSHAVRQYLETTARQEAPSRVSFWMPSLAAAACFAVMLGVFSQSRRHQPEGGLIARNTQIPPAVPNVPEAEILRSFSMWPGQSDWWAGPASPSSHAANPAGNTTDPQSEFLKTLEKSQFFLTHRSTSPELTLQGYPRIPLYSMAHPWDVALASAGENPAYAFPTPNHSRFSYLKRLASVDQRTGYLHPDDETVSSEEFRFSVNYDFGTVQDASLTATEKTYRSLPENPFLPVAEQPLSTFSIDVDTASYAIARRHLNEGQRPPVESVRLEEMINYFPMDDAPPADGKPFAVHVETASAPWAATHRLVRVALKGKVPTTEVRRPANLVFLVDTSGSMDQPNKLPLVQQSLRLLLDQLEPRDLVTLVTYAGDSELKLPATSVSERSRIATAIDALTSGGSTNGSGGITTAYQQARAHLVDGGVNRVILATDGDFNVGLTSETDLQTLIAQEAKSGVYLSVLAYGSDNLKDTTAELLADKGNGNYAYIDSLSEARRALVTQLQGTLVTIAKDVKIQVEFNPAQVAQYRLLGYENRALANKDFNDDTKDAGEIGAGHSVTALYEIIPAGLMVPLTATVEPLKYQTTAPAPTAPPANLTAQATTGEQLTVKLRYQQPEGTAPSQLIEVPAKDPGTPWAQASANFRWTAAVAGYGMLLRGSTHAGDLTWETVRQLATAAKGQDPDGFHGEFLQLIEKAAGLAGGK